MTKNQIQQRNEKAENLRVFQAEVDNYYCESSEGKICYKVSFAGEHVECTCGDYSRNSKTEPNFRCKHILAVFNAIPTGTVETANVLKKKQPKLDERFLINIDGKEFVKYPGLLDLGHQKGISGIEVAILQIPNKENANFAICKATVMAKTGDTFVDIGDANPLNCSSKVAKHLLRMAATRSIARALRSYTNIGMTCLEELGDLDEANGENKLRLKKTVVRTVPAPNDSALTDPALSEPLPNDVKTPDEQQSRPEPMVAQNAGPQNARPQAAKVRNIDSKKDNAPKAASRTEEKPADTQAKKDQPVMSTAQKNAIYNLSRRRGISTEALEKLSEETFGVAVDFLSPAEASSFIRQLQQAA